VPHAQLLRPLLGAWYGSHAPSLVRRLMRLVLSPSLLRMRHPSGETYEVVRSGLIAPTTTNKHLVPLTPTHTHTHCVRHTGHSMHSTSAVPPLCTNSRRPPPLHNTKHAPHLATRAAVLCYAAIPAVPSSCWSSFCHTTIPCCVRCMSVSGWPTSSGFGRSQIQRQAQCMWRLCCASGFQTDLLPPCVTVGCQSCARRVIIVTRHIAQHVTAQ
jgi:hypothetical protein